ncbi:MAG: UDP-3-O-(3-hydroxymyristoyl)glucosamine N-acyltransferase [Burkholderiales bacterium]
MINRYREYSLGQLVQALGGEVVGDPCVKVKRVGTLENASVDAITFVTGERFLPQLPRTRAGAVILSTAHKNATTLPRIVCSNPYAYFARVSALINPTEPVETGVHSSATVPISVKLGVSVSIGPNAVLGENVILGDHAIIGANSYLGDRVNVGRGTRIFPNVTIYHDCQIGAHCVVHAGAVIGADGFGIAPEEGAWIKVPQVGCVVIGNDVEVGANTTIDRGAIDDTIIEDGVKLDNLIQIAHNVHVGAHTAIAACTGIAGSVHIGRRCRIAGAVGIAGHLSIGDDVEISAKTLVTKSIPEPGIYSGGYPFEANRAWRRNAAQIRHLDELVKTVKQLEKRLVEMERSLP